MPILLVCIYIFISLSIIIKKYQHICQGNIVISWFISRTTERRDTEVFSRKITVKGAKFAKKRSGFLMGEMLLKKDLQIPIKKDNELYFRLDFT